MTPPHAQPASVERLPADVAGQGVSAGPFVVNLCSSTTPLALSQPRDPALDRFTFFMSRRREDGRERFRLHMGYFETLQEAEEWIAVVREFYPGAWAGEAPGKRLRAPAEPAPLKQSQPAPVVALPQAVPTVSPAAPQLIELELEASPPRENPRPAEAQQAAPAGAPRPAAVPRSPGAAAAPKSADASRSAAASGRAAGAKPPVAAGRAEAVQPRAALTAAPPLPGDAQRKTAVASRSVASRSGAAATSKLSNVREVLAALDETDATRQMPAVSVPRTQQPKSDRDLTDPQVLELLEDRQADVRCAEDDAGIAMLRPDDTGTRRALKDAAAANVPVSFAVQLHWSVQAIDVSKVPPLAIFSAYTLYTVEGSRQGRRWYGLRLGFFGDAISAKQVAHYVRSEFRSVAVVPVSPQERSRACDAGPGSQRAADRSASAAPSVRVSRTSMPAAARSPVRDRLPEPTSEFKLIDDEGVAPRAPEQSVPAKPPAAAPLVRRAAKAPASRVRARERRSPQTLEETLEILGADQLEIDDRQPEAPSQNGVQPLKMARARKSSPFTKLLDRLAERARRDR